MGVVSKADHHQISGAGGGRKIPRRRFLGTAALAAGALAAAPVPATAGAAPLRIIDSHIHLYDPTRPGSAPWPSPSEGILFAPHLPAQFRAATAGLGVAAAVVIEANAETNDNEWLLALGETEPLIAGYVARLRPGEPGFRAHLDRYARHPKFRGLRLGDDMIQRGLGQTAFEDDVRYAGEHRLTFDLVGGVSIFAAAPRLATLAPRSTLVIDHLPFPEWDHNLPAMREALRATAALPQAMAKISYLVRRDAERAITNAGAYQKRLDELWESFGGDRVIFGSNWPVSDLLAPYETILRVPQQYVLERGRAAAENFFWKNAEAAYRLKLPASAP